MSEHPLCLLCTLARGWLGQLVPKPTFSLSVQFGIFDSWYGFDHDAAMWGCATATPFPPQTRSGQAWLRLQPALATRLSPALGVLTHHPAPPLSLIHI